MIYDTHVYLGPTLTLQTAKCCLPHAQYHPPVKCGDLIRLFRLKPKRIVIIDGVYEQVPAVWHKEILLGLDNGIEILGAASMGALRAAELYPFGMKGVGHVFQDFVDKILNDDDEVAVLHQNRDQHYESINDAMVNIRATLALAYQNKVISLATKDYLIAACKRQFYPYRSLKKSILQLITSDPNEGHALFDWFSTHGLVDIKGQDAQLVLTQVQASQPTGSEFKPKRLMPVTKFIASLVDDAEIEPFDVQAAWLPVTEKNIQALSQEKSARFLLVKTLASLIKIVLSNPADTSLFLDLELLQEHIEAQALYSIKNDFLGIHQDAALSHLYALVNQLICRGSIKRATIDAYLPVAAFYFQLEWNQLSSDERRLLRMIVVCICAAHTQLEDRRLKIKSSVLVDHLRDLRVWPRFNRYNLANPGLIINKYTLIEFISLYMQVLYVYQGTRDIIQGEPAQLDYFNWLYDSLAFLGSELSTPPKDE